MCQRINTQLDNNYAKIPILNLTKARKKPTHERILGHYFEALVDQLSDSLFKLFEKKKKCISEKHDRLKYLLYKIIFTLIKLDLFKNSLVF